MYPRLSDLINTIFGTHFSFTINTFGFFIALAFIVGSWIITYELKIQEKKGNMLPIIRKKLHGASATFKELRVPWALSYIVGYKFVGILLNYDVFMERPVDYITSFHGSFLGGVIISLIIVGYCWHNSNKNRICKPVWIEFNVYPHNHVNKILFISLTAGLSGAHIFYILENLNEFLADPFIIWFSKMGLSFYGGLIIGGLSVIIYTRKKKINSILLLDSASPAIVLGYSIGRLGCMLSGDGCWGITNLNPKPSWLHWLPDWSWSCKFPHNTIGEGIPMDNCSGKYCTVLEYPVYPTSFYDFIIMSLFFIVLMLIRKKIKKPGYIFSIFIIFIGIQRFFMELIRVNNKFNLFGMELTQAGFISIIFVISGCICFIYFQRHSSYKPHLKKLSNINEISNISS
jgi:phosphatidylglycerol---prolipoprotein diacylglyceryl transferase